MNGNETGTENPSMDEWHLLVGSRSDNAITSDSYSARALSTLVLS